MTERIVVEGPVGVAEVASELLVQLRAKRRRNWLRRGYYDMKHGVGQVSEVLPPMYSQMGTVLGWTAKAVDLLARRCKLDGFTHPVVDLDELGFGQIWRDNALRAESGQAIVSALTHSCAFGVAHRGELGEPEVMIHFYDATEATGRWDPRARRLTALLAITESDDKGWSKALLYVDGQTIELRRAGETRWRTVEMRVTSSAEVPAEVLPYRPSLGRPFGRSRITRSMMGLQDSAVRSLMRLEGHMDVYSWPELWMLGADMSVFEGTPNWRVMLGRIKGLPDDEDAQTPRADVKQFPAASPEPHLAGMNALAKLFAREASLPDTALAITDVSNPTSAESYDASQYELIAEAEGATDDLAPGLGRLAARALALAHGEDRIPAEWAGIEPVWRDPRFQSRAQMADAGAKTLGALPWLTETEVGLELAGLTPQQIDRALAERRRAAGSETLQAVLAAAREGRTAVTGAPADGPVGS